ARPSEDRMPRPSRHNFDSRHESARTMASQTSNQRDALGRPVPTPETQDLYNKMREEEEKLTRESLQQVPEGAPDLLQLPSQSAARASSPSRSQGSTAPSISQALSGMRLDRDRSPVKKAAPGRHGPLPKPKQLRAALMRKLRACDDCKKRRCDHLDLCLFEAAYQATKPAVAQPLDPPYQSSHATLYQPRLGDPNDLRGVGESPGVTSYRAPLIQEPITQGGRNEALLDYDPLSEHAQHQYLAVRPHLASTLGSFGGYQPALVDSSPQHPLAIAPQNVFIAQYEADTAPQSMPSAISMPIGRQAPSNGQWDCSWGSDECDSSVSSGGLSSCRQRCMTLEALKMHFESSHAPFQRDWSMWRCTHCGYDDGEPTGLCPQCFNPYWQRWHWAYVSVPSGPTSRRLGRVTGQDGSPSNRSSWTNQSAYFSNPGGGHSSSYTFPSWACGYGNGSGQPSCTAQATAAWRDSEQRGTCCEKSSLAVCRSASPLCEDARCSLNSDATRTALIRHACPALVVLAVFLIVIIDDWLSAGAFGGGFKQMLAELASDIVPNPGIRTPEVSIACIATGLVASWLLRHVMSRLNPHDEAEVCLDTLLSLLDGALTDT
ncbi:hypothetical protein C8A03DRAFT_14116, partial [Achaetomium macrosporum]